MPEVATAQEEADRINAMMQQRLGSEPSTGRKKADGGGRIWEFKNSPGEYFHNTGSEATIEEATEAGHDTQLGELSRQRAETIREATERADLELKHKLDALEREQGPDPAVPETRPAASLLRYDDDGFGWSGQDEVRETPQYKMVHNGGGVWTIIDKLGEHGPVEIEDLAGIRRKAAQTFMDDQRRLWSDEKPAEPSD